MPNELQEQIRARAAAKDEEGTEANPSIIDLEEAARGTPLAKRRRGSTRIVPTPRSRTQPASTVRSALSKAAAAAAPGIDAPADPDASPVVLMLDDMSRVLEVFRAEEGRDPTTDDKEFWRAYKEIIRNRVVSGE